MTAVKILCLKDFCLLIEVGVVGSVTRCKSSTQNIFSFLLNFCFSFFMNLIECHKGSNNSFFFFQNGAVLFQTFLRIFENSNFCYLNFARCNF